MNAMEILKIASHFSVLPQKTIAAQTTTTKSTAKHNFLDRLLCNVWLVEFITFKSKLEIPITN